MIDTFMLKYHLDIRQRRIVYSAVNDLVKEVGMTKFLYADKDYSNARYSLYRTKAFKSEGIKELLIKDCFYPGNRCSFIKLTCKPARVLHKYDEYALSLFEEYEQVVELINSFIMKLNKHMGAYPLPLLDEWAVNRIDYAFQFATELIDSESGESVDLFGMGSGQDAADKAVMKAQTAAIKYAFMLSLCIATGDDPEADAAMDERNYGAPQNQSYQKPATYHNPAPPANQNHGNDENGAVCVACGKEITPKVLQYSLARYKRPLCMECQKKEHHAA